MAEYTVYVHFLPNGKCYVGQTSIEPEKRWLNGRGYKSNILFYNDIKRYKWNNIEHRILETNLSSDLADAAEQYYISLYDSHNPSKGYNQTYGGKINPKHNIEYQKIRKKLIKNYLKENKFLKKKQLKKKQEKQNQDSK